MILFSVSFYEEIMMQENQFFYTPITFFGSFFDEEVEPDGLERNWSFLSHWDNLEIENRKINQMKTGLFLLLHNGEEQGEPSDPFHFS